MPRRGGTASGGFVLTGGGSRRMGTDKALLRLAGGETLVEHVARQVALAAGSAILVGAPERYSHLGFSTLADLHPGEGPLGGVVTALRHSGADWNLVAACDMPGASAEVFADLLDRAGPGVDAVVLEGGDGRLHPLAAVYARRALPGLEAAFHRGVRKMHQALAGLAVLPVRAAAGASAANVNTPEDWDAFTASGAR